MAKKRHYRKLVRDKIPDIIKDDGKRCKWHKATDHGFISFLTKKLVEEAKEFQADPSNEELADVYEVLMAIQQHMGLYPHAELERKAAEKGRFFDRIILDWVEE